MRAGLNGQSPLSVVEVMWRFRRMAAMIVGGFVVFGAVVGLYFLLPPRRGDGDHRTQDPPVNQCAGAGYLG